MVVIGARVNNRVSPGTPLWVMDNDGATAMVGRADQQGRAEGEGCIFHLGGEESEAVALCGNIRGGVMTTAKLCRKFKPVSRENGLMAPPQCQEEEQDQDGDSYTFGLAPTATAAVNTSMLAAAHTTWLRLLFVDKTPATVFVDEKVAEMRDLDGVSNELQSHINTGPIR